MCAAKANLLRARCRTGFLFPHAEGSRNWSAPPLARVCVSHIQSNRMAWAERLAECEGFQWDAANSGKIRERHGVSPAECEEVFFNRPLLIGDDEKHSAAEERLYALGQTDAARLLFVVFTM